MAPGGVSYGKGLFYKLFWCMVYTNCYCLVRVYALGTMATAILFTRGTPLVRSAELA